MKPLQHAKISAKKHGGQWEDYIDIHEFFDQTKAHIPDMRHRAILHNSLGIYIAQQVFGEVRTNSAGREYSVRDIGEDHVLEDLGTIPSMASIIACIDTKHLKWLGGLPKNKRTLVTKIPRKKPEEQPEEIIHDGACTACGLEDGHHTTGCSEKSKERPLEVQEKPSEARDPDEALIADLSNSFSNLKVPERVDATPEMVVDIPVGYRNILRD